MHCTLFLMLQNISVRLLEVALEGLKPVARGDVGANGVGWCERGDAAVRKAAM